MSTYRVSVSGKTFDVRLLERHGSELRFSVGGTEHTVSLSVVPRERRSRSAGSSGSAGPIVSEVTAPIPGIVSSVKTKPGESVEAGQTLVVIEAMKMENPIKSPRAGIVKAVAVSQGAEVKSGALLISFE